MFCPIKKELTLVPVDETGVADTAQEQALPRLEALDNENLDDVVETYIADLTSMAQATQVLETHSAINEKELSHRITHYPPSHRLH